MTFKKLLHAFQYFNELSQYFAVYCYTCYMIKYLYLYIMWQHIVAKITQLFHAVKNEPLTCIMAAYVRSLYHQVPVSHIRYCYAIILLLSPVWIWCMRIFDPLWFLIRQFHGTIFGSLMYCWDWTIIFSFIEVKLLELW